MIVTRLCIYPHPHPIPYSSLPIHSKIAIPPTKPYLPANKEEIVLRQLLSRRRKMQKARNRIISIVNLWERRVFPRIILLEF